jgi:hypothetical protein
MNHFPKISLASVRDIICFFIFVENDPDGGANLSLGAPLRGGLAQLSGNTAACKIIVNFSYIAVGSDRTKC